MEQYEESPDDIPLNKILLDIRSMETDAHNANKYVQAFISALKGREQHIWPADELLEKFTSMPEYKNLLEGIPDTVENYIVLTIYEFLLGCKDQERTRMQHNSRRLPITAFRRADNEMQPAHLEKVSVNLLRLLDRMNRSRHGAGEGEQKLYKVLQQTYEEMKMMTDAKFLTCEVYGRLKELRRSDTDRLMRLFAEYVVESVSHERAILEPGYRKAKKYHKEKDIITAMKNNLHTAFSDLLAQLKPSPDTTPPSNEDHPQN